MQDGKIIKTGTPELAKELESKGYEWLNNKTCANRVFL
jgi:Fe-S cluster assembly ATPase SufC